MRCTALFTRFNPGDCAEPWDTRREEQPVRKIPIRGVHSGNTVDVGAGSRKEPAQRAALYARVFSEQQTEAGTTGSQMAALQERIAVDGPRLEPELEFIDEGYSGATLCDRRWSGSGMWRTTVG